MKTIILVRHATAVAKDPAKDDFGRSLRKKGRKEARAMARWYMKTDGPSPDLLLSSPADRAIETAWIFAKELGYPRKKIVQDEALYGGLEPPDFLTILKTLDDKNESVMVFGHDPSFTDFARFIVDGFDGSLPKSSVFAFRTNRRSWAAVRRGDGQLEIFEHPEGLHRRRDLAKAVKKDLADRIEKGIMSVLSEFRITGVDEDDAARVKRASARLAGTFAKRAALEASVPAAKHAARKGREKETP
ncbi:MAG: histidine phosphatase family protein [bacterium]